MEAEMRLDALKRHLATEYGLNVKWTRVGAEITPIDKIDRDIDVRR